LDPLVPNQVRYQTAPHSEEQNYTPRLGAFLATQTAVTHLTLIKLPVALSLARTDSASAAHAQQLIVGKQIQPAIRPLAHIADALASAGEQSLAQYLFAIGT
jgi:hypothetical protein